MRLRSEEMDRHLLVPSGIRRRLRVFASLSSLLVCVRQTMRKYLSKTSLQVRNTNPHTEEEKRRKGQGEEEEDQREAASAHSDTSKK